MSNQNKEFDYATHYKVDAQEFDYFEKRTGATEHEERRVREYVQSWIPKSAKTILDVGCGSGWVAKTFLSKNFNIISLDISKTNPLTALKLYPSSKHSGLVADSFHLPFATNSMDCIVASEIIEHVADPKEFVSELFRVIKQGGSLLITTPYKEVIQYSLCIHCNKKTPLHAHLHSFDEVILKNLYSGNELENFRYATFGNKALIHLRTHVLLKYFPFSLWKLKDRFANFFINKPQHIICLYKKRSK